MKKNLLLFLCICLFVCSFGATGCKKATSPVSKTGFYFDTVITITLYDGKEAETQIEDCFALAEKYENLFSRTKEGSDIYRINHAEGKSVVVEEETMQLLLLGQSYSKSSDGVFDITVGALTNLWDFTDEDATPPADEDILDAIKTIDYNNLVLDEENLTVTLTNTDTQIDLGGIAKGYIADAMKSYLLSQGVTAGLINLGGNVLAFGFKSGQETSEPFTIAIQNPLGEDGDPIASVKITDLSVVTSGTYQRYFTYEGVRYHHILDVSTGYPCNNGLASVTILCASSVEADALSTTCFLMGLSNGLAYAESLDGVEAIFITDEGEIQTTSGIGHSISYTQY